MYRKIGFSNLYDLFALALPLSLSRLISTLASFIAMRMVANLGEEQLAAASLALSSYIAILTISSTIFYAIGIRIRYQTATASKQSIGNLVKNGLWLALLVAIPGFLCLFFMNQFLVAMGQDPKLIALTQGYFLYMGLGLFPLLLITVLVQFYLGTGKSYLGLLVEFISFPLLIMASYFFVSQWKLGLSGFGLAMLCTHTLVLLIVIMIIYFQKHHKNYQLFARPFLPDLRLCQDILTFGWPIGLQYGGELMVMALATYLMGYFGIEALAALQLTGQYALIVFMLSFGLSQALSLKISEALGQNDLFQAKEYLLSSMLLLGFYLLPVVLIFTAFSTELTDFYMGNSPTSTHFKELTMNFFAISILFLFIDGLRNLASAALRGLHEAAISTRINLGALWLISLPASLLVVFVFDEGPIALRFSFLSGFIVALILTAYPLSKKLGVQHYVTN